ncbi:uridylate kinase [Methylotuvimicrobium buryatense]|uniref:amino acid kinase family protein n=1 Tax=Methylotuvimicrobium buryatense TaxID=95641 RepID=UPI001F3934AF|nr:uridylate kinase [Methylotuvimicrobium buryatense]
MLRQSLGDDIGFTSVDGCMKAGLRVIKFGGSLECSGTLKSCMDKAAAFYREGCVWVPGGGDFAEQVRQAQQRWHFDDITAHAMALLAMRQMALLMHSMHRDCVLAGSIADTVRQLDLGKSVIWSPDVNELNQAGVPASWEVTSDSLAAWLAVRLGADELILIKSAEIPQAADVNKLAELGIVDRAFPVVTENARFKISVVNKDKF